MKKEQMLRIVQKWPRNKGRADYLKFLQGGELTPLPTIHAKCYDCMCGYDEGGMDCLVASCPLYSFMPYRDVEIEKISCFEALSEDSQQESNRAKGKIRGETAESVEQWGQYKGKADLIKHLKGKKLTPMQAIRAKCYECGGGYADGVCACSIEHCPLRNFMPYRDAA